MEIYGDSEGDKREVDDLFDDNLSRTKVSIITSGNVCRLGG